MSAKTQSTHELPGGQTECSEDDGVVNDSLGTVDAADTTGLDLNEKKDGGDKAGEKNGKNS